jgi:hypothetical protein
MSWSDSEILTNKILNTFNLDKKTKEAENKLPVVATKSENGTFPSTVDSIDDLTVGTTWFIVEDL